MNKTDKAVNKIFKNYLILKCVHKYILVVIDIQWWSNVIFMKMCLAAFNVSLFNYPEKIIRNKIKNSYWYKKINVTNININKIEINILFIKNLNFILNLNIKIKFKKYH